jgi:hypothetical protein
MASSSLPRRFGVGGFFRRRTMQTLTLKPLRGRNDGQLYLTDGTVFLLGFKSLRDVAEAGLMHVKNSRGDWVSVAQGGK